MGDRAAEAPTGARAGDLGFCWECGARAATRRVKFWQMIGAGILFHCEEYEGELCKRCVHGYFWQYTLITLILGWWSVTAFFATPIFLVNNTVRYLLCLGMPGRPKSQPAPRKQPAGVERLEIRL
jgi:hypothetical protein